MRGGRLARKERSMRSDLKRLRLEFAPVEGQECETHAGVHVGVAEWSRLC